MQISIIPQQCCTFNKCLLVYKFHTKVVLVVKKMFVQQTFHEAVNVPWSGMGDFVCSGAISSWELLLLAMQQFLIFIHSVPWRLLSYIVVTLTQTSVLWEQRNSVEQRPIILSCRHGHVFLFLLLLLLLLLFKDWYWRPQTTMGNDPSGWVILNFMRKQTE